MLSKGGSAGKWLSFVVAAVLYWSVLGMMYYYFFQVPDESTYVGFYRDMEVDDLVIDVQEIESYLQTGTATPLVRSAIDSTFVFYRLDAGTGVKLENYLEQFEDGLWVVPPAEDWISTFNQYVAGWRAAAAPSRRSAGDVEVQRSSDGSPLVRFNKAFPTNTIGTSVRLTVRIPDDNVVKEPAVYLWNAASSGGEYQSDPRYVAWDPEVVTTGGVLLGRLNVDLSLDPSWFNSSNKLNWIQISGGRSIQWEILDAAFKHD